MSSEVASVVLPQFFPEQWLVDAPEIVHTDFPSRIRIGYVVRGDGGYSYLMREELEASRLTLSQLRERALRKLGALTMPKFHVARTPGGAEAFLSDDVDNFTAVRILLPVVRQALAAQLGAEHYAAIPCRDWFICWSKNQHAEYQEKNLRNAREAFLKDEYHLTPDILEVSGSGFHLHSEQTVDD